ncbi:MAG: 6,7-dimethyl-8-ribityllumazine synthase [Fimbriimonadaceae bacterium]
MESLEPGMDASGKKFGIVVCRWNEYVNQMLLEGALDELKKHGDPEVLVVKVPGTWELPLAVRALIESDKVDGVVALGTILQGATAHADMLASDVSTALMQMQVELKAPIAWGILTPDTQEQAIERAGMKLGNKGREAALAAIEMTNVLGSLRGK